MYGSNKHSKIIKHYKGSASYYFRKNARAASLVRWQLLWIFFFIFSLINRKARLSPAYIVHALAHRESGRGGCSVQHLQVSLLSEKMRTTILSCALWKAMFLCHCPGSWAATAFSFHTLIFHVVMESTASWHYLRGL